MADREIFAALDGKFRIVATIRPNKDTHRNRTEYDINLASDKYADVWLRGLTRHHLAALHYAITKELAHSEHSEVARLRRLLADGKPMDSAT